MQVFQFSLGSSDKISQLLNKARNNSIDIDGNKAKGTFCGRGFSGKYFIENEELKIYFSKKPFLIPWFAIEKFLATKI